MSPFGLLPLPVQLPTASLPQLNFPVRMPPLTPPSPVGSVTRETQQFSPNTQTPASEGYSMISAQDADRLLTLLKNAGDFKKRRQEYVARQRSMRSWKADFVTREEFEEISGEISPSFTEAVDKLGIFNSNSECNIMYKKVPLTSVQNKSSKHLRDEELANLFARWMQIDFESIQLVSQESPHHKFKIWNSLRYMNIHGSYCEVFVICSEFNRHLFHKEILN